MVVLESAPTITPPSYSTAMIVVWKRNMIQILNLAKKSNYIKIVNSNIQFLLNKKVNIFQPKLVFSRIQNQICQNTVTPNITIRKSLCRQ